MGANKKKGKRKKPRRRKSHIIAEEGEDKMTKKEGEIVETIFAKCPLCKKGKVNKVKNKLLGFIPQFSIKCSSCGAKWVEKGESEYKLDGGVEHQYLNATFDVEEWRYIGKKGMSKRDEKLLHLASGNFKDLPKLPNEMLDRGEVAYLREQSVFSEPRAVRVYHGGSRGVSLPTGIKGVRFRVGGFGARAESHQEMRAIDQGTITLTNKRLIFHGGLRTSVIKLNKIVNVTSFTDAFQINKEGKQKPEVYAVEDGEIWANAVAGAIRNLKK